ncbi:hypothetical protein FNF31_02167 [Cafeteria roenbergensis]|uniref:Dynein heavy chain hydrolytic ATP-binding dynein motor region domain-containing protein n=1 Tax=Cafeteria roenbergensis TaxID=33653 RepID=A0A5A8DJK6_CAFRO|nr:hypothetical protein FNF31_02167 [Cafeteria roenbergensis]
MQRHSSDQSHAAALTVAGVDAAAGVETLWLPAGVGVSRHGGPGAEALLQALHEAMSVAVACAIRTALVGHPAEDPEKRAAWAADAAVPAQAMMVAADVWHAREMDRVLCSRGGAAAEASSAADAGADGATTIREVASQRRARIAALAAALRGGLSRDARSRLMMLATADAHRRDVVDGIAESGELSSDALRWQASLRTYCADASLGSLAGRSLPADARVADAAPSALESTAYLAVAAPSVDLAGVAAEAGAGAGSGDGAVAAGSDGGPSGRRLVRAQGSVRRNVAGRRGSVDSAAAGGAAAAGGGGGAGGPKGAGSHAAGSTAAPDPATSAAAVAAAARAAALRVQVHVAGVSLAYGYAYQGAGARLVVTPLTERLFVSAALAVRWRLSLVARGPAGTGKTESVKDLAAAAGRRCVVFNCGPDMTASAVGSLLVTLAANGAWGCADEFNRLTPSVLGVCSELLRGLLDAQRAGQGAAAPSRFAAGPSSDSALVLPTTALFLTMNPGYAGRAPLPQSMTALVRVITVSAPDSAAIAEQLLLARGFESARSLGRRLVAAFQAAAAVEAEYLAATAGAAAGQASDWGLRALKGAVLSAGLRREAWVAGELSAGTRQDTAAAELTAVLEAAWDIVGPRAGAGQAAALRGLLADYFRLPGVAAPAGGSAPGQGGDAEARRAIQAVIDANPEVLDGLRPLAAASASAPNARAGAEAAALAAANGARGALAERDDEDDEDDEDVVAASAPASDSPLAQRALTLWRLLCCRHCVAVLGPAAAGKTTAWGVVASAVGARTWSIHPNALGADELHGFWAGPGKEFVAGAVASCLLAMADHAASLAATDSEGGEEGGGGDGGRDADAGAGTVWLVLDGTVDPGWAESLNSLLDDSKCLTAASGERIRLPPGGRVLLEAPDLSLASPATVSRCGVLVLPSGSAAAAEPAPSGHVAAGRAPPLSVGLLRTWTRAIGARTHYPAAASLALASLVHDHLRRGPRQGPGPGAAGARLEEPQGAI